MEQMTKTQKLLEKAINASKENETVLAIYADGDGGNVTFAGDPKEVSYGLAHIIAGGAKKDASDQQKALLNGVLNAIYGILAEGDEVSRSFATLLNDAVTEAKKDQEENRRKAAKRINRLVKKANKAVDNPNLHAPSDFNPHDEECRNCEDYLECSILWLRDKINRNNANGGGDGKRTKKANKKNRK